LIQVDSGASPTGSVTNISGDGNLNLLAFVTMGETWPMAVRDEALHEANVTAFQVILRLRLPVECHIPKRRNRVTVTMLSSRSGGVEQSSSFSCCEMPCEEMWKVLKVVVPVK
jgi:hypothetical protein